MSSFIRGTHQDLNPNDILWGLSDKNTQEDIKEKAFELLDQYHYIPTATVNHGKPESRIIDFQRLKDGSVIFMTSKGKPFYRQLLYCPEVVACLSIDQWYALRVHAVVEEVTNVKEILDEYFDNNPGTKLMYRNNLSLVAIFRLAKGEGEMFHLYDSERVRRVRFGFGGMMPKPMTYMITDKCVGCGECLNNCVEHAIDQSEDGKYHIRYVDCDDCGVCYTKCPLQNEALICYLD